MKVYVDRLPLNCLECPCYDHCEMECNLDNGTHDYHRDFDTGDVKCPLKTTDDYRKRILDENKGGKK